MTDKCIGAAIWTHRWKPNTHFFHWIGSAGRNAASTLAAAIHGNGQAERRICCSRWDKNRSINAAISEAWVSSAK